MASPLANLFIRVGADVKDALRGMSTLQTGIRKSTKTMAGLRQKSFDLQNSWRALAGAAGAGFLAKKTFELGSTVEETGSKFATVFGQSTNEVQGFIDKFGTLAGLSKEQAQAIAATTGSIVQGMGFAQEASAQFSTQVVELAGDLSSFNNIPIQETSLAIQAALTGEREQLKRLGIVLRESDVQTRALANTGKTAAKSLTDQEKATASLQLITERAGFAIGDLARTQDSAANQARQLGAEIQNIKEDISAALLPVMSVGIEKFGAFIKGLQIMGAESAVFAAQVRVLAAAIKFWDKDAQFAAMRNLRLMRTAAEETKLAIVGLAGATSDVTSDVTVMAEVIAGSGGASLTDALDEASAATLGFQQGNQTFTQLGLLLDGVGQSLRDMPIHVFNDLKHSAEMGAEATKGFTEDLRQFGAAMANSFVDAAFTSKLAIRDMVKDMSKQLAKLAVKFAIFKGLQAMFPGSSFVGGIGKSFGFFDGGGTIGAGQIGIVGERGPELVQGPANVTSRADTASMVGGDNVFNITFVGQSGEKLADAITVRQNRKQKLGQVLRVPVPMAVVG